MEVPHGNQSHDQSATKGGKSHHNVNHYVNHRTNCDMLVSVCGIPSAYKTNVDAIERTHLGGPASVPSGTKEARLPLDRSRPDTADVDAASSAVDAVDAVDAAVATCGHGASPLPLTLMRDQQSHPSACLVVHAKGG